MIESIFLTILICSLFGMGIMASRKIPLLLELPETVPSPFNLQDFILRIKTVIRSSLSGKGVSSEIILQKLLSKIRILTLKTDNKTSNWLQRLREKSQKNKFGEDDNYWQEIKKNFRQ